MGVASKTIICNLALSEIGNSRNQISDYDSDTDNIAVQCRLHYPRAVEELVRMHTWNCCTFRSQLTTSAYTGHGWDLQATMPTGWLRALSLTDVDTSYKYIRFGTEWVIENGTLLTDYTDPYLTYMKEPATTAMDSLFTQALYTMLASKLAIPVADDSGRKRELMEEVYNVILPEARRVDGFEGNEPEIYQSDWLSATIVSPSTLSQSWPPFDSGLDLGSYSF